MARLWERDEEILVLDHYLKKRIEIARSSSPRTQSLPSVNGSWLGDLPNQLERYAQVNGLPNRTDRSIELKLKRYQSLDNLYHGNTTFPPNDTERQIWREFGQNQSNLSNTAQSVRDSINSLHRQLFVAEEEESEDL